MFKKILTPRLLRSALFALCVGGGSAQAATAIRIVSAVPSAGMVTVTLNADAAATGYLTLLPGSSATCGTAANVQAGKASGGAAAYRRGSLKLTAGTPANYTVRNLAHSTDYTLCATDDAGSAVVSANFSTPAMATYTNPSWQAVGGAGVSAGMAHHQSLSFAPDGTPHVAYRDDNKGGYTTVIRYNGTAWVGVSSAGFSAGGAHNQSLSFAPDGTPYVAYMDVSKSYKTTVMRYNGTAWVDVGSTGFPALQTDFQSLTFAPDGTPYVAYMDKGGSRKTVVKRFDGTDWEDVVGTAGFPSLGEYQSLSIAPDGTPYVAYSDHDNGNRTTVMRYNGTDWVDVGSAGFSAGVAPYQSLSFAPDGTPHVAYRDDDKGGNTTVMRFVDGSWQVVGIPGFSAGAASSQSLTFAPDGTPYVAYRDDGTSNRTTVMRFVSGSWQNVGSAGFSAGVAAYQSLTFAPDGTPYVAYQDAGKTTVMRLVGLPGAPTAVTAVAGNGQATVTFTAPPANGSAITGYAVTFSPAGGTGTGTGTCAAPPATSCTVTGLTNDTPYTFAVTATNGVGAGNGSAQSSAVTPLLPVIRIVSAVPSAGMVTVTLNADAAATGHLTLLQGSGASCGSVAQITAGLDSTNAAAYRQGALALTAGANASYTVRNLAQSTSYTLCATNGAAVATAAFSTAAMATYSPPGWEAVGGAGFSAGTADYPSLSFAPDGTPYVAYRDGSHSDKTVVRRYNGTAWVDVGSPGFSAGLATHQSLAFAPDGTPYVAYDDCGSGACKTTVMRYDVSADAWTLVGNAGFSEGEVARLSLSFAPNGTPYVVYSDHGTSPVWQTRVMRLNGAVWEAVDSAGLSTGLQGDNQSLSFAPDGSPYVAYREYANGGQVTVKRLDLTATPPIWQAVGSTGISKQGQYQTLSFAPDGALYMAYRDNSKSGKTVVQRYSAVDDTWNLVGSAGFSEPASEHSLSFAPDGTPYVAYRDDGNGGKTTVMRFVGGSWETVGNPGLSAARADYQSLSFAPDGTPYVAYRDDGNGGKTTVMRLVTVPSAPTAVTAVAGDGTVAISWATPSSDGGSAITGYSVTGSPGGSCTPSPATATTCTASGLTNGMAYSFSVVASNTVGSSAAAVAASVTPVAPAPPPPPPPPPPPALIQLQVSTHGTGAGTVQRSVAGSVMSVSGNTTTVEYVEGQSVTLTAQPQAGARFSGWMGACSGLLPCHLTLRSHQAAQATFTPTSTPAPVASCRSHVFSAHEERVQDAYLAYYGRPADVGGLSYWVAYLASQRGDIAAIIDAFGHSAEFQQRFGQLSNKQLIANLYQQMYGREPEAAGAAFFESQLAAGRSSLASIALHILDGRQGSDRAVLDNRKKVARHFVTRFEELGSAAPALDDGQVLSRLVAEVGADEASALAGCARADAFLDQAAP